MMIKSIRKTPNFSHLSEKKTVTGQLPRTATPTTTAKPAWTGMNASNCDDYLKLSYPVEDSCKNIH